MKHPWKGNLEIWLQYRWWSLCTRPTVTRMFIWTRRMERELTSGGLLAERKGGVADSCLCHFDTRGREVSRQPNGIPRLSRVFRIACSRMQPFAGPVDPRLRPCPVLITTQPTQPLYTFKFFCFALARTQELKMVLKFHQSMATNLMVKAHIYIWNAVDSSLARDGKLEG